MVRPDLEGTGIPPGPVRTTGLRSHCAPGFRTTPRLAHMLDSLVRVSRRVGRGADRDSPETLGAVSRSPRSDPTPRRKEHMLEQSSRGRGNGRPRPCEPRGRRGNRSSLGRAEGLRLAGLYHPPTKGRATIPTAFSPPPNRSWRSAKNPGKCTRPSPSRAPPPRPEANRVSRRGRPGTGRAECRGRTLRSRPFAPERFHVLLNSLSKVLFNFPSRYLFAIGLAPVFSLRWSLPPALGCIPKQPDSRDGRDG